MLDIHTTIVPGTMGLRFSHAAGNSGATLGLNNDGDIIILNNSKQYLKL